MLSHGGDKKADLKDSWLVFECIEAAEQEGLNYENLHLGLRKIISDFYFLQNLAALRCAPTASSPLKPNPQKGIDENISFRVVFILRFAYFRGDLDGENLPARDRTNTDVPDPATCIMDTNIFSSSSLCYFI